MPRAVYYPYSRWLDDVALKRAVLVYDKLFFVDPVDQATRNDLYLREGHAARADPDLPKRWQAAADNYALLQGLGIVRTVDRTILDPTQFDALVNAGLRVDLDLNHTRPMFSRRRRWQMLESRLSPSVLQYARAVSRRDWAGQEIVDVPHAVAASLTLTTALVVAHQLGVAPITDEPVHDELLRQRLRQASIEVPALPELFGNYKAHTRRRVELRLLGMMAPTSKLRDLPMQDVVDYRQAHQAARRDLAQLIDQLAAEARHRPWDLDLDDELEEIAEEVRRISGGMPSLKSAGQAASTELRKPSLRLRVGASVGLSAYIAPNLPLAAGLIAGATTVAAVLKDSLLAAYDELRRVQTPEENALAYLVGAGPTPRR